MAQFYFIPIKNSQNVSPIYIRAYTIIFVPIDMNNKLSDFINLFKCNVPLGVRPSHDQRYVPMEIPRTNSNCAVSENHLRMSTVTFTFNDDVTH